MKNGTSPKTINREPNKKRELYEAPAIIYEGQITTRSGSVDLDNNKSDIDPANIFNGSNG